MPEGFRDEYRIRYKALYTQCPVYCILLLLVICE